MASPEMSKGAKWMIERIDYMQASYKVRGACWARLTPGSAHDGRDDHPIPDECEALVSDEDLQVYRR